jgi:hypothetical protein
MRYLVRLFVLPLACLALAHSARAATLLSCPPGGGADSVAHPFYIGGYPGLTLESVTLMFSSAAAGTWTVALTAHALRFDATILGTATTSVTTVPGAPPVPATFTFTPVQVFADQDVAFLIGVTGGPAGTLLYETSPLAACPAIETQDATPPLSSPRGRAAVTVNGDGVNALKNGSFTSDTTGWLSGGGTGSLTWSSLDADVIGGSGSGLITNSSALGGIAYAATQCVLAGPGSHSYALKHRVPSGQTAKGSVTIGISASPSTTCTAGPFTTFQLLLPDQTEDEWAGTSPYPVSFPPGTKSAAFTVSVVKTTANGSFKFLFDDAFLAPGVPRTLTVPASASLHGNAGTFFHTDLWVMNRDRLHIDGLPVTAFLRCLTGLPACALPYPPVTFTLHPRETRVFKDALVTLFGAAEAAGAIELTYDSSIGALSATSRTYTPDLPNPTKGTGIPALDAGEARTRTLFLGLAGAGDLSSGFRSNAGAYNPGDAAVDVTFTLLSSGGSVLGAPVTRTFSPHEAIQINDVFLAAGIPGTVTTNAVLVVSAPTPVFAYVTVIDNQSGDQVYVTPSQDEEPVIHPL